jgi:ribonuclease E
MSKQMIVNATASEEVRVAIIENNRLLDLDYDNQSRTKNKGSIYKGIVANVEDSLEAAFVEFGSGRQGFLALSDIRPAIYPPDLKTHKKPKISEILTRGQEICVQVTKDEIGNKGAAVTTYLSLPGRYVVLMHSDDAGGAISRKIDDERARSRARDMLSMLDVPDGMAVIIRTAGMNRPRIDLYRDLKALCETWEQIDKGARLGRAPTVLYREPDLVIRIIRDYLAPDVAKIIIDSEDEYDDAKSYLERRMPESIDLVQRHTGNQPIFEAYGIERAIEELFHREVKLSSGGSIVIDQTEALVAIDVNSGRSTREGDHEATVYKTNLEAAQEVARHLRLRDLGGIIVIDFIDMISRRHDRDVERSIRDAMRADKAKVKIGRITENGTLEITRQRLRQAHRLVSHTQCPTCLGTGLVRDPEGLALSAYRQLHGKIARTRRKLARLVVRLPVDVANIMTNAKRRELLELSENHQIHIDIQADPKLHGPELRFDEETRGRAGLDAPHSINDPRLEKKGRHNQNRRKKDDPMVPVLTVQRPLTIGPVPTFLLDEETLLKEQATAEPEKTASREGQPVVDEESKPEVEQHFDDPLMEALFGTAPELKIEEVCAAEIETKRPRRNRRRRRPRRKPVDFDAETNGQAENASADDAQAASGPSETSKQTSKLASASADGENGSTAKPQKEASGEVTESSHAQTGEMDTGAVEQNAAPSAEPQKRRSKSPARKKTTRATSRKKTAAVDEAKTQAAETDRPDAQPRAAEPAAQAESEQSAKAAPTKKKAIRKKTEKTDADAKPRRKRVVSTAKKKAALAKDSSEDSQVEDIPA